MLLMSSGYMMRGVVAEKENRTVEVLLTSMNARTLMIGKLIAMSIIVMIQVIVWIGGSVLILQRGANLLDLAAYDFPPGFFIWALLFLLTGYVMFASIMSAAGAIANNIREGGQVTWLLVIPLMPTLMFGRLFVEDPNGAMPMILSMFPLSAPSAMVTRLAVADVPFWQLIVSLAGVSITAYIFVVLSARFFQSQNLLSQQAFDWRRLATGWRK
ncbi:MAG: ABC transporter permease [Chloroflexi bacterium]|nr:MAG: ABC transporter permease [Chloroflexota bacterium]